MFALIVLRTRGGRVYRGGWRDQTRGSMCINPLRHLFNLYALLETNQSTCTSFARLRSRV